MKKKSSEKKSEVFFGLSDELIFQIRELLQLAIITDTHLVDHLRQLRLTPSAEKPEYLELTPEYKQYHLGVIEKMMAQVETLSAESITDKSSS